MFIIKINIIKQSLNTNIYLLFKADLKEVENGYNFNSEIVKSIGKKG